MATHLHVESLRRRDLHPEHEPHVLFQASTIGALVEGNYEGDVSFAELAEHGDLGLGTVNGIDGEMIALDGDFMRADIDGRIHPVEPDAKTPFAVVVWFQPTISDRLESPMGDAELKASIDAHASDGAPSLAVRIDGHFDYVRARSVPKQEPPYEPMSAVIAQQNVFELTDVSGTLVGFRFPDYAEGVEVAGYHLHFVTEDRSRGGHVFEARPRRATARIDPSSDLHVELPAGIELDSAAMDAATREAIDRVEH